MPSPQVSRQDPSVAKSISVEKLVTQSEQPPDDVKYLPVGQEVHYPEEISQVLH